MQQRLTFLGLCALLASLTATEASDRQGAAFAYYQKMENKFYQNLQEGIREFSRLHPDASEHEMQIAGSVFKRMLYNQAYILAQCAASAPTGPSKPLLRTFMKDCVHGRWEATISAFRKTRQITRDTSSFQYHQAVICYTTTRLPKAEEQFPPYDFLADPTVTLHDARQLDDCLGRIGP